MERGKLLVGGADGDRSSQDGPGWYCKIQSTTETMAIRVVRLGSARQPGEGVRVGTVRRPPRGVPRDEFGSRDYYDVWLPELAPSAELVSWAMTEPLTDRRWATFTRRYRAEMATPAARHLLELLAAMSRTTDLSVGCYCEDESRCHRSLLRRLLTDAGATVAA